ncbi:MAG TPA: hypothetical protein VGK73_29890 [Polyangiaceae bacterium]
MATAVFFAAKAAKSAKAAKGIGGGELLEEKERIPSNHDGCSRATNQQKILLAGLALLAALAA